jgi:hypothetical protein
MQTISQHQLPQTPAVNLWLSAMAFDIHILLTGVQPAAGGWKSVRIMQTNISHKGKNKAEQYETLIGFNKQYIYHII